MVHPRQHERCAGPCVLEFPKWREPFLCPWAKTNNAINIATRPVQSPHPHAAVGSGDAPDMAQAAALYRRALPWGCGCRQAVAPPSPSRPFRVFSLQAKAPKRSHGPARPNGLGY